MNDIQKTNENAGIPTLLCIPDISGFTKFMGKADFELSSKVIPSLLNKIIYSNEIGLKISEIEGDAVLFYRNGELPSFEKLIEQCRFFYSEFYKQLNELREKYNDNVDAKKIPQILGLKIILHHGMEVAAVPVGNHIKLMGEDVIVVHRLLKNNIDSDEYILISKKLLDIYGAENVVRNFEWGHMKEDHIRVEHLGEMHFGYYDLEKNKTR